MLTSVNNTFERYREKNKRFNQETRTSTSGTSGSRKASGDRITRRHAWLALPSQPCVDDRLGFLQRLESLLGGGDARHTSFYVVEECARMRNEESQEILQNAGHLVVRHDPNSCSRKKGSVGRGENGPSWRGLSRHVVISGIREHRSHRSPTVGQVLVCVDYHSHDVIFIVRSPELDWDAVEESVDTSMGPYFVKMRNAPISANVL